MRIKFQQIIYWGQSNCIQNTIQTEVMGRTLWTGVISTGYSAEAEDFPDNETLQSPRQHFSKGLHQYPGVQLYLTLHSHLTKPLYTMLIRDQRPTNKPVIYTSIHRKIIKWLPSVAISNNCCPWLSLSRTKWSLKVIQTYLDSTWGQKSMYLSLSLQPKEMTVSRIKFHWFCSLERALKWLFSRPRSFFRAMYTPWELETKSNKFSKNLTW